MNVSTAACSRQDRDRTTTPSCRDEVWILSSKRRFPDSCFPRLLRESQNSACACIVVSWHPLQYISIAKISDHLQICIDCTSQRGATFVASGAFLTPAFCASYAIGWDVSIRTPRDISSVEDSDHLQTRRSCKIILYLTGKIVA
jgi:hypothetical protein